MKLEAAAAPILALLMVVVGVALRLRAIAPVDGAALQQRPGARIGDARIGRRAARLDQRDLRRRIFAEPRREDTARGS